MSCRSSLLFLRLGMEMNRLNFFWFNEASFERMAFLSEPTHHTSLCLASLCWKKKLVEEMFLQVCIFSNVHQINIFQSPRRLDLLQDLSILLHCRKFSFQNTSWWMPFLSVSTLVCLFFCWFFFSWNTFLMAYPATFWIHRWNGSNCEHLRPSRETTAPVQIVMSGLSAFWRSRIMNLTETASSVNASLQIIRDN